MSASRICDRALAALIAELELRLRD